jgi:hypothetical protein
VTIVQYEAGFADNNQLHISGSAQPGDVTRILGNLRFD